MPFDRRRIKCLNLRSKMCILWDLRYGHGSLAGLVQSQGYTVTGSDEHVYPMVPDSRNGEFPFLKAIKRSISISNRTWLWWVTSSVRRIQRPSQCANLGSTTSQCPRQSPVLALAINILLWCGHTRKDDNLIPYCSFINERRVDPSYLVGGALVGYRESFRSGGGSFCHRGRRVRYRLFR